MPALTRSGLGPRDPFGIEFVYCDAIPGVGRCAANPGLNDGTTLGFSVSAYGAGMGAFSQARKARDYYC